MIATENICLELDKDIELNDQEKIDIKRRFIIFHAGIKVEYLKRFVV